MVSLHAAPVHRKGGDGLGHSIFIGVICSITVLCAAAGKYYFDRYRYLAKAKQFAGRNGLAIERISVAGLDVALSGKLDGRPIKTSVVRVDVNEPETGEGATPDVYGFYFEAYHIEVNIGMSHQWLVVFNFEYQGRERIVSPELPHYGGKYSTSSKEFDKLYFLFAETRPSHSLFESPLLLKELMDAKLRAVHANDGQLHLYFERPMFWKYSSFDKVESLIRLAIRISS